jgi:hypothetical protein
VKWPAFLLEICEHCRAWLMKVSGMASLFVE